MDCKNEKLAHLRSVGQQCAALLTHLQALKDINLLLTHYYEYMSLRIENL